MFRNLPTLLRAVDNLFDFRHRFIGESIVLDHYSFKSFGANVWPINGFVIVYKYGLLGHDSLNEGITESFVVTKIRTCSSMGICIFQGVLLSVPGAFNSVPRESIAGKDDLVMYFKIVN